MSVPVVTSLAELADPMAEARSIGFAALDGGDLWLPDGREFIALWGLQGFDLPKRELIEEGRPGEDGTRLLDVRIGSRSVFVPLFLGSDDSQAVYLSRRERLRALLDHRTVDWAAEEGSLDLVAYSAQTERRLRVAYVSGMDGDYAKDTAGITWESIGLNFLAVRPYWRGQRWGTPPIRAPHGGSYLAGPSLPTASWPGQLSSSRVLGANIPVTVTGHVPSWAEVALVGPAASITVKTADGRFNVTVPGGLAPGEHFVLDSDPRHRRAEFGGVSDWSRLGSETRWRPLAPGPQLLDIVVSGATDATTAIVSGDSLYETAW